MDTNTDRPWWRRWWVLLIIAFAVGFPLLYVVLPDLREGVDSGQESTLS